MKKILMFTISLLTVVWLKAEDGNLIESTLLNHVMTVTQFQNGKTKLALMDSVIQIGKYKNRSIFDLQAGFNGNTRPQSGEPNSANLVLGGFLKVSPFLAELVIFPEHWKFLSSLEHGFALNYDTREQVWRGSYQVGLAFTLNPQ